MIMKEWLKSKRRLFGIEENKKNNSSLIAIIKINP